MVNNGFIDCFLKHASDESERKKNVQQIVTRFIYKMLVYNQSKELRQPSALSHYSYCDMTVK